MGLEDTINARFREYIGFSSSINAPVPSFYKSLLDKENHFILSHLADADGLSSELVLNLSYKMLLNFMGIDDFSSIHSERIMQFSGDEQSEFHIKNIVDILGHGNYTFADLATLDQHAAEQFISEALVIDHHRPAKGSGFFNINPHLYGFDGEKECSGSIGSFLFAERLFDYAVKKACTGKDKKDFLLQKSIKAYQENIDILGIIALAGANADMQGDQGINKAVYSQLLQKRKITSINHPFYGHATKPLYKVLAESTIPFNLKHAFSSRAADDFTDDFRLREERESYAKQFLFKYGFDSGKKLCDLKMDQVDRFKDLYRQNIERHADPNLKEIFLKKLEQKQHLVYPNMYLFGNTSIAEVGNLFTSLSKLGHGNLIKEAYNTFFFKDQDQQKLEEFKFYIKTIHGKYKYMIAKGMGMAENLLSNSLENIGQDAFIMGLDHLKQDPDFTDEILPKLVGVYGGLIANTRRLPANYGILFTHCTIAEDDKKKYKISARRSEHPRYAGVDLGNFMQMFGGGGHKGAASCKIPEARLDDFKQAAAEYLGGRR